MLTRFTRTIALLTFTLILFAAQAVPGLAQSTIGPEDVSAPVGSTVTVAVETSGFTDLDVSGYQFTATFDPTVIEVVDVSRGGTISDVDGQFETNQPEPGELRVALASSETLGGEGPLLNLEIDLVGAGSTPLALTDVRFFDPNGNEVDVSGQSGTVESTVKVEVSDGIGIVDEGPVKVPIRLSSTPGAEPSSYQFTLTYDESIVEVTGVDAEGTLSGESQADPEFNQTGPGEVKVSFASSSALQTPGVLINLLVEPQSAGRTTLSLGDTFRLFELNGDEIPTRTEAGEFASGEPATAQIIHNAADPAADTVDVYFEDEKQLDDFAFRTATPFMDVPGGVELEVGVAPGDSEGADDIVASQSVTFDPDMAHTVVANGVMQPDNFEANPDGKDIGFEFFVQSGAKESASNGQVAIRAVHGVTDAPTVDIEENGTTLFDNGMYGDISGYISATPEQKRLVVSRAESNQPVAAFHADLSPLADSAVTVLASGFLDPSANQDGPGFALLGVLANGDVITFEPNQPPQITAVPTGSVQPTQTFQGTVEATDPDGDSLSYALAEDPDNATIDDTGAFQFTPTCTQRNSDVSFAVIVSDGVASADSSFTISVEALNRQTISVDINRTFGDATKQTNYRLVGLPGRVDRPISQTLEGESGRNNDWRVFWDNGASSTQSGLVEFDGSSQFNFRPGRGFWVLSRETWNVSGSFDPVELNNSCGATIPLHSGWNIISNPLGKDVSWTAVQNSNGVSVPLWSYDQGFSQASSFASAASGNAFYFLNEQGLSQLSVPFVEGAGTSSQTKKESNEDEEPMVLKLTTRKDTQSTSSVFLGLRPDAKNGKDKFDHFAPPNYFEAAALRAKNEDIKSKYALASDMRPADAEGQTFTLSLETKPGTELTIEASGMRRFEPGQRIELFNPSRSRSYDLRSDPTIEVMPESKTSKFVVMIGSESYVQSKQSELAPRKVKLHQNYPNPFREQTTIRFALPEEMKVRLEVYDLLGRRVKTLVNGRQSAGVHALQWDGQSRSSQLASGTYIVRLQAGDQTRTMKMVLVK